MNQSSFFPVTERRLPMTGKKQKRKNQIRYDSNGKRLRENEMQLKDGRYRFDYKDHDGKKRSVTAKTLQLLREKEKEVKQALAAGLRADGQSLTLNQIAETWFELSRGRRDTTFSQYHGYYYRHVAPTFGLQKIRDIKKSDVRRFFNELSEKLSFSTVSIIHTVVHQILEMAVEDDYIKNNPADKALRDLHKQAKQDPTEKVSPLSETEQQILFDFINEHPVYKHWSPLFTTLVETGVRVGEAVGLRWQDVDFENGVIHIDHCLVYVQMPKGQKNEPHIHPPKTSDGVRDIPLTEVVREALQAERKYQQSKGIECKAMIDGYTDFIFLNKKGWPHVKSSLNTALTNIVNACNKERGEDVLPHIHCHMLRHTFATRKTEDGMHPKKLSAWMGHKKTDITMECYTDVSVESLKEELDRLNGIEMTPILTPNVTNFPINNGNIIQLKSLYNA